MRIQVGQESQTLTQIINDGKRYQKITEDKEGTHYLVAIQNLGEYPIYIENGEDATIDGGYCLYNGNSVSIKTKNLNRLSFICEKVNDNIRIITN